MKDKLAEFLKELILSILASALFAIPTKILWNEAIIEIFEINPITYFQALALVVICRILFIQHL